MEGDNRPSLQRRRLHSTALPYSFILVGADLETVLQQFTPVETHILLMVELGRKDAGEGMSKPVNVKMKRTARRRCWVAKVA